jgi:hypothetical protein
MSVHTWAKEQLQRSLKSASAEGFEPALALRALLSAVVEESKGYRSPADLAQELQFLADNLDDDRDYSFMRP